MRSPRFAELEARLAATRDRLARHPLHRALSTTQRLRAFMEAHVFAVWDFMSLVKRLQRDLTSVEVPWTPRPDAGAARLINEIVLGEESDRLAAWRTTSHYELYLLAMEQVGAATGPIRSFVERVRHGEPWESALSDRQIPLCAAPFVRQTLATAIGAKTHEVAAAFLFGREGLVPVMFDGILEHLAVAGVTADAFRAYLARHIEVDAKEHGPLAAEMLGTLCREDDRRWSEAEEAARKALAAREAMWDDLLAALPALGDDAPPR
jgi:hypothetical protein